MFSRHYRKARILFSAADVLLTALAFQAAYHTRLALSLERVFYIEPNIRTLIVLFSALAWPLCGLWLRVYDRIDSHPRLLLRDAFRQCLLAGIGVVLWQFSFRLDLSRPFLGFFLAYNWILICLFRLNAARLRAGLRLKFGAHYVLIVGIGESAHRLAGQLEQNVRFGVRLLGFLEDPAWMGGGKMPSSIRLRFDYPVYPLADLSGLLEKRVIDEIIFAVDSSRLSSLEDVFLLCDEEGVRNRLVVDFFPHVNSQVYLEQLGSAPLLTFSAAPHDEVRLLLKRAADIVLAAAALVLLAPVMLLVATAIRLTSPGPAIFRQVRCGLNGRRFVFYKFRSMCQNAEELKDSLRHLNRKQTAFKIPDDPRLTGIGKFLRKFSIDEWPQLWNVLRGDMSLVGPRPAVPEEVERYQRWQRRRLRMRPGLTCLWALAGRDSLDFETWMKMDMQYIDQWSLALDWKILLCTIPRVLTGQGAN